MIKIMDQKKLEIELKLEEEDTHKKFILDKSPNIATYVCKNL